MIKDMMIEKYIVFANNQQMATFGDERSAKKFCKQQRKLNPDSTYSYRKQIITV